jgi:hypothetical protein
MFYIQLTLSSFFPLLKYMFSLFNLWSEWKHKHNLKHFVPKTAVFSNFSKLMKSNDDVALMAICIKTVYEVAKCLLCWHIKKIVRNLRSERVWDDNNKLTFSSFQFQIYCSEVFFLCNHSLTDSDVDLLYRWRNDGNTLYNARKRILNHHGLLDSE